MNLVKATLASRTIIAALITILASATPLVGIVISPEMQTSLTDNIGTLVVVVSNLIAVLSAIGVIHFRRTAIAQIGGILNADPTKVPDPAALSSSQPFESR